MSELAVVQSTVAPRVTQPAQDDRLWAAAQMLETSFLSEMLKSTGLSQTPGAFGGGAGEEHFSSFLRDEQAGAIVQAGGIGLAESLFEAMKRADNG